MGKLADLNIPVREGNLRNPERLNRSLKDIGQKAEPWKRLATEGFGQVLLGDEGTIPWYMSFAPGADLTDKLMEGRQPGLLDMPGPGTLAKMAMLPIMKLGAKEILEGTARMGKNARNLDKAKNPVIERWHRTRSMNDVNIRDKGLLVGKDNPNYGKNTGDQNKLKIPAAWLGTNPTEIPVLQYYATNNPDELSTYRVRIPKEEYYSTPRLKWDSGYRGDASDARIVAKGESSLTGEVGRRTGKESLIDLFGKSIPAEYLEKIPNEEINKHAIKNKLLDAYIMDLGEDPSSLPLSKAGTMLANEDLNWMPFHDRISNYTKLKDVGEQVSEDIKRKPNIPPSEHLRNALNFNFAPNQRGKIEIPAYAHSVSPTSKYLPYDSSRPVGKFENRMSKPKTLYEINIPTDEQIQVGAVSRGLKTRGDFDPRWRLMDWDAYNSEISKGLSPVGAMRYAKPAYVLKDTPDNGLEPWYIYNDGLSGGHISRGTVVGATVNLADALKSLRSFTTWPEEERFNKIRGWMRSNMDSGDR